MRRVKANRHVVQLLEVIDDRAHRKIHFVLEFMDGVTLHRLVKSGGGVGMIPAQLQDYLRQLAAGLDAVHRAGACMSVGGRGWVVGWNATRLATNVF